MRAKIDLDLSLSKSKSANVVCVAAINADKVLVFPHFGIGGFEERTAAFRNPEIGDRFFECMHARTIPKA